MVNRIFGDEAAAGVLCMIEDSKKCSVDDLSNSMDRHSVKKLSQLSWNAVVLRSRGWLCLRSLGLAWLSTCVLWAHFRAILRAGP